jgi:hypothetical protein
VVAFHDGTTNTTKRDAILGLNTFVAVVIRRGVVIDRKRIRSMAHESTKSGKRNRGNDPTNDPVASRRDVHRAHANRR